MISYAVFISAVFFVMPENPDEISAPMELVNEFRAMSVLGVSSFWVSIGSNTWVFFGIALNLIEKLQNIIASHSKSLE